MFEYSSSYKVKRVCLLILLMTQSMFVQVSASDVAVKDSNSDQQRTFQFPGWSERRVSVQKERVPPPPPGPYMSIALSGSSIDGASFSPDNKPAVKLGSPIDAFSPDIPWPSNITSPERWKPGTGYNYVEPAAKSQPYRGMPYNMPPNYNYGDRAPIMNWPDTVRDNAYAPNGYPQSGGYARSRRPVMNNSAMQYRQPTAPYPVTGQP